METNKKLEVKDLRITFKTDHGLVQAVRDVSFDLYEGETLCIVGESGSGKSVTSKAIMQILANNAIIEKGSIIYEGQNLLEVSEEEFHKIRGHKIGMIFQDPLSSLNPIVRIGKQITEATLINANKFKKMYEELISKELIAYKNAIAVADIESRQLKAKVEILKMELNKIKEKATEEEINELKNKIQETETECKEKVERINKAKEKVLSGLINNFKDEDYVINKEEHNLMQEIVDESYTQILGKKPYITPNTLIISSNANVASIVEDEFDDRNLTKVLKANFPNNKIIGFKEKEEMINIDKYENILIYSYDAYNDQNQKEVINEILQKHNNVYVISLKGPNDQKCFKGLVNYSCLYEYTPNSIRTVVRQLKQQMNLNGKLPK